MDNMTTRATLRLQELEDRVSDEARDLGYFRAAEAADLALTDSEKAEMKALREALARVDEFNRGASVCPWGIVRDEVRKALALRHF